MKARIVNLAPETNLGKTQKLEDLYCQYKLYLQVCIDKMISDRRTNIFPSERRSYFPPSVLSSQIVKNIQNQAVDIVKIWNKQKYAQKLRKHINSQKDLTDHQKLELRCTGKYQLKKAGKFGKGTISQEMVDLYQSWVWDPNISGNPPRISDHHPMYFSEMTCVFGPSKDSTHFSWWLRFSSLENGVRIEIPLAYNPYIKSKESLAKTVLVKKRNNQWTFQFCEKSIEAKEFDGSQGKIGLDVGLNVIASTSDGRLYGKEFKSEFDHLYGRLKTLRANRQRQNLLNDSKRLARLESKLSGKIKTITGTISNKLVKSFPDYTFVIEDLNLKGCRGQKRFAYKALHNSLSHKAKIEEVNPAYSSQTCPSCGHVCRANRSSIRFTCKTCGRKSHADAIGGINLLRRSEDKQINSCEDTSEVRVLLRKRYLRKRNSFLDRLKTKALKPNSLKFTTKVSSFKEEVGTASNQTVTFLVTV
jgi:transposase